MGAARQYQAILGCSLSISSDFAESRQNHAKKLDLTERIRMHRSRASGGSNLSRYGLFNMAMCHYKLAFQIWKRHFFKLEEWLACVKCGSIFVFRRYVCLSYVQFSCLCYERLLFLLTVQFAALYSLRSSRALRTRWARSASLMVYPIIISWRSWPL